MKYKRSRELISEALINLYPNDCQVNRLAKQLIEKKHKKSGWCEIKIRGNIIIDGKNVKCFTHKEY